MGMLTLWAGIPLVWASLGLYGAGIGLELIARGTLPLALFGARGYATLMGVSPCLASSPRPPRHGSARSCWSGSALKERWRRSPAPPR